MRRRSSAGAQAFVAPLVDLDHRAAPLDNRLSSLIAAVAALLRRKTLVLMWPLITVFGLVAQRRILSFSRRCESGRR